MRPFPAHGRGALYAVPPSLP